MPSICGTSNGESALKISLRNIIHISNYGSLFRVSQVPACYMYTRKIITRFMLQYVSFRMICQLCKDTFIMAL